MKRQRDVVFVPTLKEAHARAKKSKTRKGFSSVARTRGATVTGEMKYYDTELGLTAIPASVDWTGTEMDPTTTQEPAPVANPLGLFQPTIGSGVNQRIGKSCKVLGLKINGLINVPQQTNAVDTDAGLTCRVILYQDMQTNSTQAQGEQLMTDPTTNSGAASVNTFQNINNFGRFRVLKDKHYTFPPVTLTYDGTNMEQSGMVKTFKMKKKFKNPIIVRFNATNGGTVADVVDNSFHVIASCNNAGLVPSLSYICRATYKE